MRTISVLAVAIAFVPLGLSHRPGAALVSIAAIGTIALVLNANSLGDVVRNFLDPFLPLVVMALVFTLAASNSGQAKIFLLIFLTFVIARATRSLLAVELLLPGLAIFSLALSVIYFSHLAVPGSFPLQLFNNLDSIGKNQVGWAVAFGTLAAAALVHLSWDSGLLPRIFSVLLFASTLLVSASLDSLTGFIAALIGLSVTSFFSFLSIIVRNPLRGIVPTAPVAITFSAGIIGLSAVTAMNYLADTIPGFGVASDRFLQRDFSTLTGREKIWSCFSDASNVPRSEALQYTQECTVQKGAPSPGHLHNNYLELSLHGGWPAAAVLIVVFAGAAILATVRLFNRSRDSSSRASEFFALSAVIAGALISVTESFLFNPYLFAAFALFLGPSALIQKLKLPGARITGGDPNVRASLGR